MYDATIATWESKYFYGRPRPSELDHDCRRRCRSRTARRIRQSTPRRRRPRRRVLAYFLPAEAASFQAMAEEAGWSRVLAGLQYPSDYEAGLELGRKVAEQVIAKAKADGSDAVWTGTRPDGPVHVDRARTPATSRGANWKPLLLELSEPVPAAGPAGLRLGRRWRPRRRSVRDFPRTHGVRDQLQGVLLAEPGGPEPLALPVHRQVDASRIGSIRTRRAPRGPMR